MIRVLKRVAGVAIALVLLLVSAPVRGQVPAPVLVAERVVMFTGSPDGSRLLYNVEGDIAYIYQRPLGGITSTVVARFPAGLSGSIIEFAHHSATDRLFYIEYTSNIQRRLISILPDGSGQVVLDTTDDLNHFARFDLSPDGRWLVYARGNELRVVPTEGGQPRTLVSTGETRLGGSARITSDSAYVYSFVAGNSGPGALYRYRLGAPETILIESDIYDVSLLEFPVLSSARIIYSADTVQGQHTVEYTSATAQKRRINDVYPGTLSADQQTLVYKDRATGFIMAQDVAGKAGPRTLVDRAVWYSATAAAHVVFTETTGEDQRYRISSVPIAGGPIRVIGVATQDEQSLPFLMSPDGSRVVYRDQGLVSATLADNQEPVVITPAPERARLELASVTILPSGYVLYIDDRFEGAEDRIQLARLDRLDVQQLNTSLFLETTTPLYAGKGYYVSRDGRMVFFSGKSVPEPAPYSLYQAALPAPQPQPQPRITYLPLLNR